jgi:hypothetical protein
LTGAQNSDDQVGDDAGLSARIGADQLGYAKVSMTQHRYMHRGRVHVEAAELLDRASIQPMNKRWRQDDICAPTRTRT